jgi:hypothetical protein
MGFLKDLAHGVNEYNDVKPTDATTQNTNYDVSGAQSNAFARQGNNDQNVQDQRNLAQALIQQSKGPGVSTDQQQQLANTLQAQSQGQGPSLAQQQLANATNQNASNAASQVASQKGINPAQAARMVGQNQAAANQQAAGQSAMTRAQEQFGAQNQQAGVLNNIANTQLSNRQQALQAQQTAGGVMQGAGSQALSSQQTANSLLGTTSAGQNSQNNTAVQNHQTTQGLSAQISGQNADRTNSTVGSLINAGGAGVSALTNFAHGGIVPGVQYFSGGGGVDVSGITAPLTHFSESFGGSAARSGGPLASMMGKGGGSGAAGALGEQGVAEGSGAAATAGMGDVLGEVAPLALLAAHGGGVPGKAAVRGDSPRNDTVPAVLSPGEVVLPRSVTQSPDADKKAAAFVAAIKKHKGTPAPKADASPKSYGEVVAKLKDTQARLARLEAMVKGKR